MSLLGLSGLIAPREHLTSTRVGRCRRPGEGQLGVLSPYFLQVKHAVPLLAARHSRVLRVLSLWNSHHLGVCATLTYHLDCWLRRVILTDAHSCITDSLNKLCNYWWGFVLFDSQKVSQFGTTRMNMRRMSCSGLPIDSGWSRYPRYICASREVKQ